MELSSKISSLEFLKSVTKWCILFECLWLLLVFYMSLQTKTRVHNLSLHINFFHYLCGDRRKCGSWRQYLYNCLSPTDKDLNEILLSVDTCIRQKQKHIWKWKRVVSVLSSLSLKHIEGHKYNSLSIWTYSIRLQEVILVFDLESKITYVTLVEWGTWRDDLNSKL